MLGLMIEEKDRRGPVVPFVEIVGRAFAERDKAATRPERIEARIVLRWMMVPVDVLLLVKEM